MQINDSEKYGLSLLGLASETEKLFIEDQVALSPTSSHALASSVESSEGRSPTRKLEKLLRKYNQRHFKATIDVQGTRACLNGQVSAAAAFKWDIDKVKSPTEDIDCWC